LTATTLNRVRQVASDIFAVPVESIGADSSMDTIEAWDSMQHLNLVLALEEKFDVHFSPEEMEGMRSLGIIAAMLEAKTSR
jgi:acyl carrier protein